MHTSSSGSDAEFVPTSVPRCGRSVGSHPTCPQVGRAHGRGAVPHDRQAAPVDDAVAHCPAPCSSWSCRACRTSSHESGCMPHPNHAWPANYVHHPFEKMFYKRAMGPLCTKGGNPIRVMTKESVKSNTWSKAPKGDVPDITLPDTIPAEGNPNWLEL